MFRRSALLAMAVAVVVLVTEGVHGGQVRDGIIVSVAAGKLVVADGIGEHPYDVGLKAKITLDGKPAKLAELKTGDGVRVAQNNEGQVVAVAALRLKK